MHSFTSIVIHCVWSTKKREPLLSFDVRSRLWPYLGGIARENKMKALAIGGVADHVHMLISGTLSVSKLCNFSKAIPPNGFMTHFQNCTRLNGRKDMARSVLVSPRSPRRVQYISDQAEHHRKRSFCEEFVAMLRRHNFDYDERMLD
jgi:REP element-mobilizing transposase RayT